MSTTVRVHEPLSRHTALRTGGPCDEWVVAHDMEGLTAVIADCRAAGRPLAVLGAGTRTVVRDGPVPGAVLRLGTGFCGIRDEGETLVVGAATPVPALVGACVRLGRTGVEGRAAVPGSVGASVLLDDGWDEVVQEVEVVRQAGPRWERWARVSSRGLRRGLVVARARLRLCPADPAGVAARARAALAGSAPIPPGSWYAPAQGEPVRDVFRSVRLDMVRLRQVAIPSAAPELLVNLGQGTAADLALLTKSAFERVKRVRGSQLEPRIRWMGRASE